MMSTIGGSRDSKVNGSLGIRLKEVRLIEGRGQRYAPSILAGSILAWEDFAPPDLSRVARGGDQNR
jgi:hypothetical protein